MKFMLFTLICLVVLVVFLSAIYVILKSSGEFSKNYCDECGMYDKTLHACWLRFEKRYPGDQACDAFYNKDADSKDDEPNT